MRIQIPVQIDNTLEVIVTDLYVNVDVRLRPCRMPYGVHADLVLKKVESDLRGKIHGVIMDALSDIENEPTPPQEVR